jgi:cyclopropane fatty-acyl-phospholipid synthase-like methyltransferase
MSSKSSYSNVSEYYASVVGKFWELVHKKHMHVGFFDASNPEASLYEASLRLTEMMIAKTDIQKGELFADLGCGYGVPAMFLTKAKDCRVIGLTASPVQCEDAVSAVKKDGLESSVQFIVGDATKTEFKERTFDGGWFFESIFHMGHDAALKEAHRILKPGAELLIADFYKLNTISEEQIAILKQSAQVNSLVYLRDYPTLLENQGFHLLELIDISDNTMKQTFQAYPQELENRFKQEMLDFGGVEGYDFLMKTLETYSVLAVNALGYCLVRAKRLN